MTKLIARNPQRVEIKEPEGKRCAGFLGKVQGLFDDPHFCSRIGHRKINNDDIVFFFLKSLSWNPLTCCDVRPT